MFFFFKQKTAYEMCGRDWSSDVCSSDLKGGDFRLDEIAHCVPENLMLFAENGARDHNGVSSDRKSVV